MSVDLISGLPGTGKSLTGIKRFILPALKKGRKVYTNIEGINLLRVSLYLDMELHDVEKLLVYTEKFNTNMLINDVSPNSLVVIDEAQVYWNNRDYASEENKRLLPFLQKHRHYGLDIIFLTQNIDQLDIGIRRLCQVHYRLARLTNVGLNKIIKVKVYPDAMGSEQFKPMANLTWTIDKGIFPLYKSYVGNEVSETKNPIGNVIFKNSRLLFAVVVIIICIPFVWHKFKPGAKSIFVPSSLATAQKDFSKFSLGEFEEYYCGDKFYVFRSDGKIDIFEPKDIPPNYCPRIDFTFRKGDK